MCVCALTRIVATAMSQVYKLVTPHFLYTLRMNANARTTLVNQGGIVEVSARFLA